MSRRKTVNLNMDFTLKKIKEVCRSYVVFSENMGRSNQASWVSDWKRGKNLPSPEEAAQMCAILQVRPEDILVEQDDIELVRSLIGEQKEKPPVGDRELSVDEIKLAIQKLPPDALLEMMGDIAEALKKKQSGE